MFKAELPAAVFKSFIGALIPINTECRLHVDFTGISATMVDKANVAMVDIVLKENAFTHLDTDSNGEMALGLDIEKISGMLAMLGKNDSVELEHAPPYLKIRFAGYEYALRLVDVKSIRKDPVCPTLALPARFTIDGKLFAGTISSMEKGIYAKADKMKVWLSVEPTDYVFTVETRGENDERIKRVFRDEVESPEVTDTAQSLFSMDYLKDMAKVIGDAGGVLQIALGKDHPVQFSFEYADGCGKIMYILAPRLEPKED